MTSLAGASAFLSAFALIMYVMFDGMDLGVGIALLREAQERDRDVMVASIAPVWDGNETWIVLAGAALFGAFSTAYGILMPALYVPLMIMLVALIFRGVSFEFRFQSPRRPVWDRAFAYGSLVAAAAQGALLGGLLAGVSVDSAFTFAGSPFDFLRGPVALVTIVAAPIGYAFMGSAWLVLKTDGPLRRRSARRAATLGFVFALLQAVGMAVYWATSRGAPATAGHRLVPLALVVVSWSCTTWSLAALRAKPSGAAPLRAALAAVASAAAALFASLWPAMVPPSVSIAAASSDPSSQRFFLIGMCIVVPVVLAYSGYAYYVFRGTAAPEEGYGGDVSPAASLATPGPAGDGK